MMLLMVSSEKWGLILGTMLVAAVILFILAALMWMRPRRSGRVRDAIGTVNEFAQAHSSVDSMTDANSQATARRVLDAARIDMDDLVPEPHQPNPNLRRW